MTLGATVSYREGAQSGEIPAEEFFVGPMVTTLPMAAVLTGVRFPVWRERVGIGFQEISSRRSDFAFASAAAQVALAPDGTCARIAIGVGAATETPLRLSAAEQALTGARLTPEAIRAAVTEALAGHQHDGRPACVGGVSPAGGDEPGDPGGRMRRPRMRSP